MTARETRTFHVARTSRPWILTVDAASASFDSAVTYVSCQSNGIKVKKEARTLGFLNADKLG